MDNASQEPDFVNGHAGDQSRAGLGGGNPPGPGDVDIAVGAADDGGLDAPDRDRVVPQPCPKRLKLGSSTFESFSAFHAGRTNVDLVRPGGVAVEAAAPPQQASLGLVEALAEFPADKPLAKLMATVPYLVEASISGHQPRNHHR